MKTDHDRSMAMIEVDEHTREAERAEQAVGEGVTQGQERGKEHLGASYKMET